MEVRQVVSRHPYSMRALKMMLSLSLSHTEPTKSEQPILVPRPAMLLPSSMQQYPSPSAQKVKQRITAASRRHVSQAVRSDWNHQSLEKKVRQTHACPPHIFDAFNSPEWTILRRIYHLHPCSTTSRPTTHTHTHSQHVVQSGSPRSCAVTKTPRPRMVNRSTARTSKKRPCCNQPQQELLHRLAQNLPFH